MARKDLLKNLMAAPAPGMPAMSRTPANGEARASEVAGRTAAMTNTEPM